jgi:hypothetical protein
MNQLNALSNRVEYYAFEHFWKHISQEDTPPERTKFEAAFVPKMYLYEAASLRILIGAKERDIRYEPLLLEFEKFVFPKFLLALGDGDAGRRKVDAVKGAMVKIQKHMENPHLTWVRDWFLEIGHDETNPATLMMFVMFLSTHSNNFRKFVQDIRPA